MENNQLVELLKELANQMGIAVDWTSQNIRPYIIDIMGRLAIGLPRILDRISLILWADLPDMRFSHL